AKFQGQPEHVVNYMFFVAEELRAIMALLGFRTVAEMVGRTDCIVQRSSGVVPRKARTLDFSRMLAAAQHARRGDCALHNETAQDHGIAHVADRMLLECARPAIEDGARVRVSFGITNAHRTFGAMLAGEIARR